ncbi:MAG: hypothetical protein ACXVZO_08945, partial [Gaiellaceae bacterium]
MRFEYLSDLLRGRRRRPLLPSAAEVAELLQVHDASFDDADVEGIRALLQGFIDSDLRARLA